MSEQSSARLELTPQDISAAMSKLLATQRSGGISLNPETVQHDLAKLVLSLIEFLRRLLELQAIRRMERGALTAEEEEQIGLTLMKAREQVLLLARQYGLDEQDLNLDLGPLGKLM